MFLGSWRGAAVAVKQLHQDVFEGAHGQQELAVRSLAPPPSPPPSPPPPPPRPPLTPPYSEGDSRESYR
jgi:hypothetical protein